MKRALVGLFVIVLVCLARVALVERSEVHSLLLEFRGPENLEVVVGERALPGGVFRVDDLSADQAESRKPTDSEPWVSSYDFGFFDSSFGSRRIDAHTSLARRSSGDWDSRFSLVISTAELERPKLFHFRARSGKKAVAVVDDDAHEERVKTNWWQETFLGVRRTEWRIVLDLDFADDQPGLSRMALGPFWIVKQKLDE